MWCDVMIRKIKILFVLSLLLLVSIGAVSAIEDADMNITSSDGDIIETSDAIDVVMVKLKPKMKVDRYDLGAMINGLDRKRKRKKR